MVTLELSDNPVFEVLCVAFCKMIVVSVLLVGKCEVCVTDKRVGHALGRKPQVDVEAVDVGSTNNAHPYHESSVSAEQVQRSQLEDT